MNFCDWLERELDTRREIRKSMLSIDGAARRSVKAIRAPHERGHAMRSFMQFFQYGHLPPYLQTVARPFHELAIDMLNTLPANPESTVAMRKLMEAKDCAIRAIEFKAS